MCLSLEAFNLGGEFGKSSIGGVKQFGNVIIGKRANLMGKPRKPVVVSGDVWESDDCLR
jgi:hypothetical protein